MRLRFRFSSMERPFHIPKCIENDVTIDLQNECSSIAGLLEGCRSRAFDAQTQLNAAQSQKRDE